MTTSSSAGILRKGPAGRRNTVTPHYLCPFLRIWLIGQSAVAVTAQKHPAAGGPRRRRSPTRTPNPIRAHPTRQSLPTRSTPIRRGATRRVINQHCWHPVVAASSAVVQSCSVVGRAGSERRGPCALRRGLGRRRGKREIRADSGPGRVGGWGVQSEDTAYPRDRRQGAFRGSDRLPRRSSAMNSGRSGRRPTKLMSPRSTLTAVVHRAASRRQSSPCTARRSRRGERTARRRSSPWRAARPYLSLPRPGSQRPHLCRQ